MTPLISVVMPSHRGAARLPATLAALCRQALEPSQFEVIVVLDGPDPEARAALAGVAVPFKLTIIEQAQAGAAAARNRGAAHACAPLLLFLDDDMAASPGLLAAHLEGQASHPGSVLLGYFHQPRESDAVDLLADGADHWWAAHFDALGRLGRALTFKDLCAGNFSVPRRTFETTGGFANYFAGAAGEDYELGIRLFRGGVPFHYLPAAKSAHRYRAALDRTLGRARAEGIGDVRIARHHPDAFRSLLLARAAPAPASGAKSWVPWAPAWFLAAAPAVLAPAWRLFAALKLRRPARGLLSFMRYCAYWRGARGEAGSAAGLEALVRDALAAVQESPAAAWMPPLDEALDAPYAPVRAARHGDWRVPERTFVGEYDVAGPVTSYSDSLDYGHALILVRDAGAPVGVLKLEKPRGVVIDRAVIGAALREPAWIATLARRRLLAAYAAPRYDCPPISVVVCTRDRAESLRHCLASLRALDYPAYEVIVVDNASLSGETRAAADAAGCRYVREDRPGLDWARNCGYRAAQHDLIAYTDDDVEVDRRWLRAVAAGFNSPGVQCVTGLVLPRELETRAQHLFEIYGKEGMSKGFTARRWVPGHLPVESLIRVDRIGVGANMAFRRALFDRAGEFDTALDVGTPSGGGGDLDMLHRVLRAGGEIRYVPDALAWHRHRRDLQGLRAQIGNNGRAFGVYLLKRARDRDLSRAALAAYVATRWLPWLVGSWILALLGRHRLPPSVPWAELRGAAVSWFAYRRTYRNDARVRAAAATPGR